jgi:radical SAM protein with 4Fe4S-binding SPASM domain
MSSISQLIQDVKRLAVKAVEISGGGEPTVYPYLGDIITGLNSIDVDVAMISNFLNIPESLWKAIGGLRWVRVSLIAMTAEEYHKITGNPRDFFVKACNNVLEYIERFRANCYISATIMIDEREFNNEKIVSVFDFASYLHLDQIFFKLVYDKFRPKAISSYIDINLDLCESLEDEYMIKTNLRKLFSNEHSEYVTKDSGVVCSYISRGSSLLVTADGNCYGCLEHFASKIKPYGNINKQSLVDIISQSNDIKNQLYCHACSHCRVWSIRQEYEKFLETGLRQLCYDPHSNFL